MVHVYCTEALHIRQMTDTLLKTPKGADYKVAVTLRQLQSKHPKYSFIKQLQYKWRPLRKMRYLPM